MPAISRKWLWPAVVCLLILQAAMALTIVHRESLTFDEDDHMFAGYMMWKTADFGLNPEHPPLAKLLATVPLLREPMWVPPLQGRDFKKEAYSDGRDWLARNDGDRNQLVFRMRASVELLAIGLCLAVFLAAREWFGDTAGLLALLLVVFDPNVLAHSALVTTDIGVSCFFVASIWTLYRYSIHPTLLRLLIAGITTGLLLATKHSGVLIGPMLVLLMAWEIFAAPRPERSSARSPERKRTALRLIGAFAAIVVVSVVVLWSFYGFRYAARPAGLQLSTSLAQYAAPLAPFQSRVVLTIARLHLLPESYLMGLVDVKLASVAYPTYLLGKVYAHGQWDYFPFVILIKTTLGLLALLALAVFATARGWLPNRRALEPVMNFPAAALGGNFSQFEKRGVTHTGRTRVTSDDEMGKIAPSPSGCGEKLGQTLFSSSNLEPPSPSDSASSGPVFGTQHCSRESSSQALVYVLIPPVVYLAIAMASGMNIGARHLLPMYAFTAIFAAAGASALTQHHRRWGIVCALLVAAHILSTLAAFPNEIAYANEAWGGPKNVHKYLSDANVDWAQQLFQVKQWQDRHPAQECWFAYFARPEIDPATYGIRCHALPTLDTQWLGGADLISPTIHGSVLISAGDLSGCEWPSSQLNPYRSFQRLRPQETIDDSVFVYQGTFDMADAAALARAQQSATLLAQNQPAAALVLARQAVVLEPDNLVAQTALGDASAASGDPQGARIAWQTAIQAASHLEPDAQAGFIPDLQAKLKALPR